MDESVCIKVEVIQDECLEGRRCIRTGGFGQIYRAKHKTLGRDVAIKLLHYDKSTSASSILREALLMLQGGNPNVIQILGLYEGEDKGRGLVMEFMPRGSVADLLQTLTGPPPWPLTFRMAHEISLGMNFLHHLSPPLLHLDLKPSNVLLDNSLQAKLTDFGLSRVARSVSQCSSDGDDGGTLSYMPPEALQDVNYKASKASDVYSYGVLLWSLVTGKEPYIDAMSCLVRFRIHHGDRPDLACIDTHGVRGLEDTVKLMTKCWHQDPRRRPPFLDCVHATEKIFEMHKHEINEAVYDVLKQLDDEMNRMVSGGLESLQISPKPHNEERPPVSSCVTEPLPKQEAAASYTKSGKKDNPSSRVFPQPPPPVSPARIQRQVSTPEQKGTVHMSNVYGVQIGNNNTMNIVTRQRHRTAPSNAGTSYSNPQNSQKKPQ